MLDTTTKKRIDDCRDILVGKLPDPKAQIEQITIGLIYKFMDDMDKEAIELGGAAKFFSGDYEKYSWGSLFDTKVTAAEMLRLYSEAIESMEKNPNIPQLFRNIFNNAYLPYRDPETLKLFLKTIGEFEYTHSEMLGDAFEYLLSVMGSQGDAGQFRTPRHIIDFLVAVVNPGKNDTILDPACGTAGFLISAFKQIKEKNNNELTPDERKKLIQNFVGYDISPDMVRLSLVNLYLHGFSDPDIHEYDTLSSEERWNDSFDVILANPPFMSPKGGIRPHKKFSISSNRSEVLFVDYIAEHLNPNGRAGIIVPEGVIFQSGIAYKELRKMLVDNYLYAVVSLPSGIFNPYSGVKTSILLMDKELAKKRNGILFVKIDNDGFNLGAQRNAVKGGQLEEAIKIIHDFATDGELQSILPSIAHIVHKTEIAKNGDYNLSGERYKSAIIISSHFNMVPLSDEKIFTIISGGTPSSTNEKYWNGEINWATLVDLPSTQLVSYIYSTVRKITNEGLKNSSAKLLPVNSIFVSTRATIGRIAINKIECSTNQGFKNIIINNFEKANSYFVALMMTNLIDKMNSMASGGTFKELSTSNFKTLEIPLPPLPIQEEIVAEIEGYQKIIDGAKMVVENYKPKIDIDPEWEMVELGSLLSEDRYSLKAGPFGSSIKKEFYVEKGYKVYGQEQVIADDLSIGNYYIDEKKYQELNSCKINANDILISLVGTVGKVSIVPLEFEKGIINPRLIKITLNGSKMTHEYFKYYFKSESILKQIKQQVGGVTMPVLNGKILKALIFPLPPLETQRQIVAEIEKEQALVKASKQLIQIFEQKIKDRIAKVWGTEKEREENLNMAAEAEAEYEVS